MISTDYTNMFEVQSRHAYVVYDGDSGTIVHIHRITTFRGGEARPVDQHEARALEMAQLMGHNTERLRVMSIDPEAPGETIQRVDVKSGKLVSEMSMEEFWQKVASRQILE